MHENRKLIIGLGLALLAGFSIMFYIGSDQHHEKMMARDTEAPPPARLLSDSSPGAQQFRQTCTSCHGLPDPKQYTANEWPLVIARMQQHMISDGKTVPDAKAIAAITNFLQLNAM